MANDVQVVNLDTGAREYIDAADYDPAVHELVGGQVLTVDPLAEISGVESEVGLGLDIEREQADSYEQVSAERRAGLTREATDEALYGDEGWTELGRGLLSGATFGISEALTAPDDPFEREARRRTRDLHADMYAYGNLAGALVPGLLSGGTGLLGSGARLLPAGRVAAGLARYSARGTIGRQLLAGAVDGALDGFGYALAEQSLSENPIAADVILSRTLTGGLMGGSIAGGLHVAGRALSAGARALRTPSRSAEDLLARGAGDDLGQVGKLLDDTPTAGQVGRALDEVADGRSWRSIFTARQLEETGARETVADIHRALERTRLVNRKARSAEQDLLSDASMSEALARGVPKQRIDEAAERLRRARAGFSKSSRDSRAWAKKFDGQIGEEGDEVTALLSKMDAAKAELDDAMEEVASVMLPPRPPRSPLDAVSLPAPAARPDQARGLRGLAQRGREKVRQSRVAGVATDVVAGAELLSDITGLQPTRLLASVPVIGEATSLYLKYRALKGAFGRRRRLPKNATTEAAVAATSARDRIASAAAGLGRGAGKAGARKIAVKGAGAIQRVVERAQSGSMLDDDDRATLTDLDPDVVNAVGQRAQAMAAYIQRVAPPDPLRTAPYASDADRVNPYDAEDFSVRLDALEYPDVVMAAVLEGAHDRPSLALEAIEAVYPDVLAQARMDLQGQLDAIVDRVPQNERARFGLLLGVPLDVSTTDEYRRAMTLDVSGAIPSPPDEQQVRRAAPRVATVAADLEQQET